MSKEIIWHTLSWKEAVKELNSNIQKGLSEKDVKIRQQKFGKNLLPEEKLFPKLKIFLEQLRSPLIYILIIAGIITLILGEYMDSIVIFGAVVLNTVVGYFQENKAIETLRALKKVVKIKAKVIRAGYTKIVDSGELVPGDIIILNSGDKVPADARIIEAYNLKIDQMALTGEWLPDEKHSNILPDKTPMADRDNLAYMGTIVEDGKAKAVVIETGVGTKIGEVAKMVKETKEEKTPLQKKLFYFSKIISAIIVLACLIIFIQGIITGNSFIEMFTVAVAIAVAAIPEGLPVAMTVILALGMQRILKRKGLVRKLLAAETLGSTNIICTDKTLTLTEGKMRVSEILTAEELLSDKKGDHLLALRIAALANEAFIENPEQTMKKWVIRGRPTDKALLLAAMEVGINKKELEKQLPLLAEFPFDPVNKYLAKVLKLNKKEDIIYVSGAPEKLLEISKYLKNGNREIVLTPQKAEKIKSKLEGLASKGLRVVAVAYKKIENVKDLPHTIFQENNSDKQISQKTVRGLIDNLVFVGLIALKDPIREGVKRAMKICRQAGMKPIIVTGDHKLTAKAVAKELGFRIKEENIMEGKELDELSKEEFRKKVKKIQVYARVEPKHKMRIVQAWQEAGEVVAMTGDGINDAPALKKADIGVALGSGTEVAKGASDLILLNDDFSIIVAAVEEGRAIIDNIRKVITYLLAGGFAEIILVGVSILVGFPLPVTAAQILWVNLIEGGPLSLALAFEPKEKDLMRQKPQGRDIPLLTKEMKALIFIIGLVNILLLLGLFFWLIKYSGYEISHIRSIIFACLTIDSIFYVFSCKSLRRNLWHINPFSNKFLILTWALGVLTLIASLYIPFLQTLLKTVPLNVFDWLLILTLGLFNIILIESTKWYFIVRHQTDT